MWAYNNTEELYHFGVPGMKWGKRKAISEYATLAKRRASTGARNTYAKARNSKYGQKAASGIKTGYNKAQNNKYGAQAIAGAKKYNAIQKDKAQQRSAVNAKYGKHQKTVTVAKTAGKGVLREGAIRLGALGVTALATTVALKTGNARAANAITKIGNVAITSARVANNVHTGKNIVYDLMNKN